MAHTEHKNSIFKAISNLLKHKAAKKHIEYELGKTSYAEADYELNGRQEDIAYLQKCAAHTGTTSLSLLAKAALVSLGFAVKAAVTSFCPPAAIPASIAASAATGLAKQKVDQAIEKLESKIDVKIDEHANHNSLYQSFENEDCGATEPSLSDLSVMGAA